MGGHGSAEKWMEREKHTGLGYCIPVWETERPQQDEEQDRREAKRKGSSQPRELSEGSKALSDYWGLEISYSIHYFRTHLYMTSDNREIFTCVSV